MTMRNLNAGVIYSSSILGNNIPVGLGISSSLSSNRVAWIQTGDGAIEEGVFYESLVFSKARSLPVVFILEDNNWSLGTSKERRYAIDIQGYVNIRCSLLYISSSYPLLLQAFVFALARSICILFKTPSLVHVDLLTIGAPPSANGRAYVSYLDHSTIPTDDRRFCFILASHCRNTECQVFGQNLFKPSYISGLGKISGMTLASVQYP